MPEDRLNEPHRYHMTARVSIEHVLASGGSIAELDGGNFALGEIADGEYFVCLCSRDTGQGLNTTGCDLVDLPATGTLEITTGEGGVHVEVL